MIKHLFTLLAISVSASAADNTFVTEGNGIKNIALGNIDNKKVVFISELNGGVSSYSTQGKKRWHHASTTPAVMFEIEAEDINGDNNDDLLAASGDGHIYAWDSSGDLLWKFSPDYKVRFSEITVVKNANKIQIFAGGNDSTLYELNSTGQLVSSTPIKGVVRKIESGHFTDDGKENLLLMTYAHDKFRWEFLGLVDASSKKTIKSIDYKNTQVKSLSRFMLTDMEVADIDNNGKDDILFFGDISFQASYFSLDHNLELRSTFNATKKQRQRYAHTQGVFDSATQQVIMRHGGIVYLLDSSGKLLKSDGEIYKKTAYNDLVINTDEHRLLAAGALGGGNGVYSFDLNNNSWITESPSVEGRLKEVNSNIATLYQQTLKFVPPSYQKRSDKSWVMIGKKAPKEVMNLNGADLQFITQTKWDENTDRGYLVDLIGKDALKRDRRVKYNMSRDQIIAKAKKMEQAGTPFILWAGHGTDPFFLHIDTMEAILKVAPKTCYGFLYAEMHNPEDPRVQLFVNEYVPRLAKAIRVEGKAKLYFRYKNMFWGASSHQQPWKDMFYSGKYADILVPASEDTSSRTQEINLAGRVGMMAGGYIDDFAMRIVDDNPTSWRPLTPGGQKTVSPYLRQGVMMAAYGARFGILFNNKYLDENASYASLIALMKSGVLPLVEPENILSIGSWHLMNGVDKHLIHSVDDHHNMMIYDKDDTNAVMSVGQMHWAGASLPEHDFSKIALGVDFRWMNYMPEMPHGMVPIAPIEYKSVLDKKHVPYSVSDTKYGYVKGKKVAAADYAIVLKDTVNQGDKLMPVIVHGASWSAIKLDDSHIRVIMVDPGYINPKARRATLTFNHQTPKSVTDILSKETLTLHKNTVELTVPAGSMRFVDLAY
ncbi:PQQ-binding-like beta-propeller repeat protein [Colwellia sp. UCD-KL20]|uniref:PQQ-binding-like beta-propeller repeat protein n=1 Tax=Colwellia sp. UCD-KL20 TaxID=1917165 RepID=UPI0009713FA2|nr:PQQ-binding-like beta-propeller repeat protein [Colwellia sp. UCD-KL20]